MSGARKPLLLAGLAALATVALAGCDTKAEVVPLEEAKYQPPKPIDAPLVRLQPRPAGDAAATAHQDDAGAEEAAGTGRMAGLRAPTVRVGDQLWVASATEYAVAPGLLQPVASARGQTFHALSWDEPPYDRLLVNIAGEAGSPGKWREYLEVY